MNKPAYRTLKEAASHFVELRLAAARGRDAEALLPALEADIVAAIERGEPGTVYGFGDYSYNREMLMVVDGKLVLCDHFQYASSIAMTPQVAIEKGESFTVEDAEFGALASIAHNLTELKTI